MKKFVALKPVRFDRDYAIGEEIPGGAIDGRSLKRLLEWGKIAVVDTPEAFETAPDPPEMACHVCGKVCGSKSALTQHLKTHTAA